ININFDDRGRLWLTESVEYPFPVPADKKPRDAVKILEFANGQAKAVKVTTFAEGLNIPIGVLPLTSLEATKTTGAIAHSIPNVWRLLDSKGNGQADQREVLLASIEYKDTHGMTGNFIWGFDGYVYATHGFANNSTVKAPD